MTTRAYSSASNVESAVVFWAEEKPATQAPHSVTIPDLPAVCSAVDVLLDAEQVLARLERQITGVTRE